MGYVYNPFTGNFDSSAQAELNNKAGLKPVQGIELAENWISGTAAGNNGWTILANSGSIGTNITAADGSHFGIVRLSTSTSATSAPTLTLGSGFSLVLGSHSMTMEWVGQIATLSDAAEEYIHRGGFNSATGSGLGSNCVMFEYDRTLSANWRLRAIAGGVSTVTTSATPVVAGSWLKFRIEVNSDASSAEFFIDDVSVGTVAGLPSGNTQTTSPGYQMIKTVGTTERVAYLDWWYFKTVYGQ